jgi:putative glutamine amidotransferase
MRKLVSVIYADYDPFSKIVDQTAVGYADDLNKDSVLLLHGGGDIHPMLYNKPHSSLSGASDRPSFRDRVEVEAVQRAKELDIPIIGICRGAQLLCAMAGGHLIQHVDNHSCMSHPVTFKDGTKFNVNSLHHQMMYPFDIEHELLAWSTDRRSHRYLDVDDEVEVPCEPELVYFPQLRGIAIQWHPEMMHTNVPSNQYLLEIIPEILKL